MDLNIIWTTPCNDAEVPETAENRPEKKPIKCTEAQKSMDDDYAKAAQLV